MIGISVMEELKLEASVTNQGNFPSIKTKV